MNEQLQHSFRRRIQELAGISVNVWIQFPDNSWRRAEITDVMGVETLELFVKPNAEGQVF